MTVQVVPFAGAGCGAEIRGVDIREPLSAADRDAIRRAWLDHLVLRFRGAADDRRAAHGVHPPVRRARIQPGQADREAIRGRDPDRRPQERNSAGNFGHLEHHRGSARRSAGSATARPSGIRIRRLSMCRPPRACCAHWNARRPRPAARPISSTCTRPMRHCRPTSKPGSAASRRSTPQPTTAAAGP